MMIDIQVLKQQSKTAALMKLDRYPELTSSFYDAAREGKTYIKYITNNIDDAQELISLALTAGFTSFITGDSVTAYIGWGD